MFSGKLESVSKSPIKVGRVAADGFHKLSSLRFSPETKAAMAAHLVPVVGLPVLNALQAVGALAMVCVLYREIVLVPLLEMHDRGTRAKAMRGVGI